MVDINPRIQESDQISPSPEDRAAVVLAFIRQHMPDLTNWDLICFCSNYLAAESLSIQWLQPPAKEITRLVYTAHYLDGRNIETGLKR
jgi:hypothetical protein